MKTIQIKKSDLNNELKFKHIEEVLNREITIGSDSKKKKKFTFNAWYQRFSVWHEGKEVTKGAVSMDVQAVLDVYNKI